MTKTIYGRKVNHERKCLVVMADDFGMHAAINDGIVSGFADGVLTDANVLTCCPAVDEALAMAGQYSIPVGAHIAFTSEWDLYRWGPITSMTSMVDSSRRFYPTVELAWQVPNSDEVRAEVISQIDRLGCKVTHIGEHMGGDKKGLLASILSDITRTMNIPHKGQWRSYEGRSCLHYAFKSAFSTSGRAYTLKELKLWLRQKLAALVPGYHLWVCHPGEDSVALEQMCTDSWPPRLWAREIRKLDLSLLIDEEVSNWLAEYEIELVPLTTTPVAISEAVECRA